MDSATTPPTAQGVAPSPTVVNVPVTIAPTASGGPPTAVEVSAMISSTMVKKRKRAGTHVVPQAPTAPVAAPALTLVAVPKPTRPRAKLPSAGPKGAPPAKTKKPVSRSGQPPPEPTPSPGHPTPPAPAVADADKVFDVEPAR